MSENTATRAGDAVRCLHRGLEWIILREAVGNDPAGALHKGDAGYSWHAITRWEDWSTGGPENITNVVLVEVSDVEAAEMRAGRMHKALRARIDREVKRCDDPADPFGFYPRDDWDAVAAVWEVRDRCKLSNRGRKTGPVKLSAPTTAVGSGFDPLPRPNGALYFPRAMPDVPGGLSDVDVIRHCHERGRSVLLKGAPGTGKTALLEAALPQHEYVAGTGDTDTADFVGSYVPKPDGGFRWVDGPLLRAMKQGIALIVDEIALIDARVLSVIYAATDGRREVYVTANPDVGTVAAAAGFCVHGACNPDAPGSLMSEALLSRMTLQMTFGTDYDLAGTLVPAEVLAFARNMEQRRIEGEVSWSPQMRELLAYRDLAADFGHVFSMRNMLAGCPDVDQVVACDLAANAIGQPVTALEIGGVA